MKKTLLGLLAASALLVGSSSFAEAKANFHVYFGVPYYDYQVGPGYIYDPGYGWYQQNNRPIYGRQQLVCLVTFFTRVQVSGGADAYVQCGRILPRREALRRDRPNDRNRIFTYGSNRKTIQTCRYVTALITDTYWNFKELQKYNGGLFL